MREPLEDRLDCHQGTARETALSTANIKRKRATDGQLSRPLACAARSLLPSQRRLCKCAGVQVCGSSAHVIPEGLARLVGSCPVSHGNPTPKQGNRRTRLSHHTHLRSLTCNQNLPLLLLTSLAPVHRLSRAGGPPRSLDDNTEPPPQRTTTVVRKQSTRLAAS
jgi:hypothetical protein